MLGLLYMLHEAQWVRRVDRRLEAPSAAADLDGLTFVQLSDFHVGFRPSFNLRATRKAVDMALAARPDLVLITGDFACGPHGRAELQRQLRRLAGAAPLGVFGVLGQSRSRRQQGAVRAAHRPAPDRGLRRASAR